jgi:nicotinamide riboside kinase
MRIALSGSAGTGKSTLAALLGRRLGLPVIGEGMREHLERTGVELHRLSHSEFRALVWSLWEEREEAEARAEREAGGFVADRAGVDYAAFWMYYHFAREDVDTAALMREALAPGRYDHIFLLPWGAIPLVADGVRTADRFVQLHVDLLIRGLAERHGLAVRTLAAVGVEERAEEVSRALKDIHR